jgi:hypothetical protein
MSEVETLCGAGSWGDCKGTIPCVAGKSVAVVGAAESVKGTGNGNRIDACDVVIRINKARLIEPEEVVDVGSRTDVVYCRSAEFRELRKMDPQPPYLYYGSSAPIRHYLNNRHFVSLVRNYQINPNTGTILLIDLALSKARSVFICGMDFFQTGDRKTAQDAGRYRFAPRWPGYHDYEQDRLMVRRIVNKWPRIFQPDAVLAAALEFDANDLRGCDHSS